jgi:hypothetical protein
MGKKEFAEYLEKQEGKEEEIDWGKKRDEWLDYLNKFYNKVETFLRDFSESKNVSVNYPKKSIIEELIGEYEVHRMILLFKGNQVVFEPIGTNLIAAKGRVDMKGSAGTVRFVLVPKNSNGPGIIFTIQGTVEMKAVEKKIKTQEIEWDWKIATEPPRIRYIDLNEDSFFDSLMKVTNG